MSDQTEQMPDERDTEGRLLSIIGMNYTILRAGDRRIADHSKAAQIIAAEIDALTRERDESRAEADRLRPAAEAWEADQYYGNLLWSLPIERDTAQEEKLQRAATRRRETNDAAHAAARQSDARARAAKGAK